MCKSQFSSKQSLDCKPLHNSQQLVRRQIPGACSTADRQATCQVASTQASTSQNESTKVFVPLAHDFELVVVPARKVVLWITPSGAKDAQTAVRRPLPP